MPDTPEIVGIGAIFIDDIVLPTGQTYMGQLGGGVTHALMGAALWDSRPGIVAVYGEGLPDTIHERLSAHLDTRGLTQLPLPQMRAWQLFEEDGTRRELYRVQEIQPFTDGAQPEHFPDVYRDSRAYYLLQGFEGIRAWRDTFDGILLWEPLQQVMLRENREIMRQTLQSGNIDIISPNLAEARAIYGDLSPEELLHAFYADGANIVAIRMGQKGSLIGQYTTSEQVFVSTVSIPHIIDHTGAGNTYCGALLLGFARGLSLKEAAAMATVSASFCLEQRGVLDPARVGREERDHRLHLLLA